MELRLKWVKFISRIAFIIQIITRLGLAFLRQSRVELKFSTLADSSSRKNRRKIEGRHFCTPFPTFLYYSLN